MTRILIIFCYELKHLIIFYPTMLWYISFNLDSFTNLFFSTWILFRCRSLCGQAELVNVHVSMIFEPWTQTTWSSSLIPSAPVSHFIFFALGNARVQGFNYVKQDKTVVVFSMVYFAKGQFHHFVRPLKGNILGALPSFSIYIRETNGLDWPFSIVLWMRHFQCSILALLPPEHSHIHVRALWFQ